MHKKANKRLSKSNISAFIKLHERLLSLKAKLGRRNSKFFNKEKPITFPSTENDTSLPKDDTATNFGQTSFQIFRGSLEWKKRIVVFAPHPDDETLGCGGTIAKKTNEGYDVYIVYMTNGQNSHQRILGMVLNPSPQEVSRIRKAEAKRAAKLLGVNHGNLIFLNFEDGTLEKAIEPARERVLKILEKLRPSEIYYPRKNELHGDHRFTSIIVKDSIKMLRMKPKAYKYAIWPSKVQNKKELKNEVVSNISRFAHMKQLAIQEYKSQTTIFLKTQERPILSSKFLKKFRKRSEKFIVE